jgi:hypothetical protein
MGTGLRTGVVGGIHGWGRVETAINSKFAL